LSVAAETETYANQLKKSEVTGIYYIDSSEGNDSNDGGSPDRAWRTLARASRTNNSSLQDYHPGDRILLKCGQTFVGSLAMKYETGSATKPIVIGNYGTGHKPIIDGRTSSLGAIDIGYTEYIEVEGLELTGKGVSATSYNDTATKTWDHIYLRNIDLHDIQGHGINFLVSTAGGYTYNDILIRDCTIKNATGIGIAINKWTADTQAPYHSNVTITHNTISNVGKAGIQLGRISHGVIRDNKVTNPGHGPAGGGSGLWTWYCGTTTSALIVENNIFQGARGKTDAMGASIDIGNTNVIYQRNLSIDNEGGFMAILGNSRNCVYRYNISINDGARVNGVNGAKQQGVTFCLSGYTGADHPKSGPFNNYIYNNTIYVKAGITSNYWMQPTAAGALFVNNIIYVAGPAADLAKGTQATNIIFNHNLVYNKKVPATPFTTVNSTVVADPQFAKAGGLNPADYLPHNQAQVVDQGITLTNLPSDQAGVSGGLAVATDFFGNPIVNAPEMGAIEVPTPITNRKP
jgi:Right handed beta helix region